jgi:hypothetical protein
MFSLPQYNTPATCIPEKFLQGHHGESGFYIFLQDAQWLDQSSICSIQSILVNTILFKIAMPVGLFFTPRKEKVMDPCHVTDMFLPTSLMSTVKLEYKLREGARKVIQSRTV